MRPFSIEEISQEQASWIYPETNGEYEPVHGEPDANRVAVKIRRFTPGQQEHIGQKMISKGVIRRRSRRGMDEIQTVPGRELERYRMFAEAICLDCRGITFPDGDGGYSHEGMAKAFLGMTGLFGAVHTAALEFDDFFGVNGAGS